MRKKVDQNQKWIMHCARMLGASAADIHEVGRGIPDLIIGFRGVNLLVEVKSRNGRLTPAEAEFAKTWQGQICIISSTDELINLLHNIEQKFI